MNIRPAWFQEEVHESVLNSNDERFIVSKSFEYLSLTVVHIITLLPAAGREEVSELPEVVFVAAVVVLLFVP